jgi:hypothetical protein
MRSLLLSASILVLVAAPAMAQGVQPYSRQPSNINQSDTRSKIAPALPSANLGPNATATDYLRVAQRALSTNQLGLAQSSIEDAETLLLTRAVPYGAVNQPDNSASIQNLNQALQALASRDVPTAMNLVQQTISMQMSAQANPPPAPMAPPPGAVPPPPPAMPPEPSSQY